MNRVIRWLAGNRSDFGLVIDRRFHSGNRWVSAYAPFLVKAIVAAFDPVVISSQAEYDRRKRKLRRILSFEPGWAAPKIRYDGRIDCVKAVMYSDPHYEPAERRRYFDENRFDAVLSLYRSPFFRHFPGFPEEKFVHFPWAVPDAFLSDEPPAVRSNEVAIFGGRSSKAYDVRNWCREQPGITGYDLSGVENKRLRDGDYYLWLRRFDAVVAAGSSNPDYDLVTPKYFEIAAAGALLIGQRCADLPALGFDEGNCLLFSREDFLAQVERYRRDPEAFLRIRERGRELIRSRHRLSDRIAAIREVLGG
jgi:hypothetical protein